MSRESYKCSVCGGAMKKVNVVATRSGRAFRYKCTCGHSEDLPEDQVQSLTAAKDSLALDGFEEFEELS